MGHTTEGGSHQGAGPPAVSDTKRIAMVLGVLGAVAAVFIALLYDWAHRLAAITGVTQDAPHLYFGFFIGMAALGGACLIPVLPRVAAVLLAGAAIAFFVDVGWWALLASPLLVASAILAVSNHGVDRRGSATWRRRSWPSNRGTTDSRRDDGLGGTLWG